MLPSECIKIFTSLPAADADYTIVAGATHNDWLDTSGSSQRVGIRSYGTEEYVDFDGVLLVGAKRSHRGAPQDVIDEVVADGRLAIICHPNQNPGLNDVSDLIPPLLTREMSIPLTGATDVEIYTSCLSRRQMEGPGSGSFSRPSSRTLRSPPGGCYGGSPRTTRNRGTRSTSAGPRS